MPVINIKELADEMELYKRKANENFLAEVFEKLENFKEMLATFKKEMQ